MERSTLTRRGLFRSLGTAALVAGCAKPNNDATTGPQDPNKAARDPDAVGFEPAALEFVLDGHPVRVETEARTTLLELLRLDLGQTGTKLVCDRGACGACMVLVDGVARNSCMLLAHDVAGCEVQTVAGLSEQGQLSALQAAFVEHDAMQCGFCTSGMLISSAALLRRKPGKLEPADVQDAIAGNLCRCGTYHHVVAAVLSVANGQATLISRSEVLPIQTREGGA